jgi:hypothetical protein
VCRREGHTKRYACVGEGLGMEEMESVVWKVGAEQDVSELAGVYSMWDHGCGIDGTEVVGRLGGKFNKGFVRTLVGIGACETYWCGMRGTLHEGRWGCVTSRRTSIGVAWLGRVCVMPLGRESGDALGRSGRVGRVGRVVGISFDGDHKRGIKWSQKSWDDFGRVQTNGLFELWLGCGGGLELWYWRRRVWWDEGQRENKFRGLICWVRERWRFTSLGSIN